MVNTLIENYLCGFVAYTLQLFVKDGLTIADQLAKNLRKSSPIVSAVRKSTHATDVLEGQHRIQTANATRWNSQLKMIRSVLRVPEDKLNSLNVGTKLTTYDRNILSEPCDILAPFEEVTYIVQRDQTVSTSLVIPSVLGLTAQLEDLPTIYHVKFITTLKSSTSRRLTPIDENCSVPRFSIQASSWTDVLQLTS